MGSSEFGVAPQGALAHTLGIMSTRSGKPEKIR